MQWFKRHPDFLRNESSALSNDSNYQETYQYRDNLFLSHGNIVVRLEKVYKHPILIVYTDGTPYQLPLIYPLQSEINDHELEVLAKMSIPQLHEHIQLSIKYYYELRHQNSGGSLCILEWDNLDDGSKFYGITSVLKRLRDWYAGHVTGHFPLDNQEVEFTAHFVNVNQDLDFLYPDGFLDENLVAGQFYATLIKRLSRESSIIYYGSLIDGISKKGMYESNGHYLFSKPVSEKLLTSLDFQSNKELVKSYLTNQQLLTGLWFHVNSTLVPFVGFESLLRIIGNGDFDAGIKRLADIGAHFFEIMPDHFVVGIRYPNKRKVLEFQLFKILVKKDLPAFNFSLDPLEKMRSILNRYDVVEAIPGEKLSDENFHLRNSTRASHGVLKSASVNLFGVGALGGEIGDCLAKAGVGTLALVDDQEIKAHNPVRHLAGLSYVGIPKTEAVKEILTDHNPFIHVHGMRTNLFPAINLVYHSLDQSITISSLADDNLEGFINEHAVIAGRTMFYVRALRGGKAGRIFRVIPGKDACFQCINLYMEEKRNSIKIEEDESFPIIKNECNNPVRPASAADLKLIAAIASKIVIDHFQEGEPGANHWIWSTEVLETAQIKTPFSLTSQHIPPHPRCFYCNHDRKLKVSISSEVLQLMKNLVIEKDKIETGGVLAGSLDQEGNIRITHASKPGPNAVHARTEFKKDVLFCQKFLDDLYQESGKETVYMGEWHSHPDKNNKPSGLDIKSLSEIGLQKEYLTVNPAMIIFSNAGNPSCTVHPAGKRHYFVDLEITD
jgi:integrative and conjugative element protein (TIGR02256 family)